MNDLFPQLEPPAGGRAKLHAKLHERAQKRGQTKALALAAFAGVLVVCGLFYWQVSSPAQPLPPWLKGDPAISLAMNHGQPPAISSDSRRVALQKIISKGRVTYYHVGAVAPLVSGAP